MKGVRLILDKLVCLACGLDEFALSPIYILYSSVL